MILLTAGSFIHLGGVAIDSDLNVGGLSDYWGLDTLRVRFSVKEMPAVLPRSLS